MKTITKKTRRKKLFSTPIAGLAVLVGGVVAPLCLGVSPAYAADTTLYLAPASGTVPQNSNFNVAIRLSTGGEAINAVEANLSYSTGHLQFVGLSAAGSAFGIEAPSSGGSGKISINRGNTSAVSGDVLVVTVTFKALASSGSSLVTFTGENHALNAGTEYLDATAGGTFGFSHVSTAPAPSPAPAPPSAPPGAVPSATNKKPPATPPAAPPAVATPPAATTPPPAVPAETSADVKDSPAPAPMGEISDKMAGSKAVTWGVSGLLIVAAAAVAGKIYFGRRHAAVMGPAATATPAFGPSAESITPNLSSTPYMSNTPGAVNAASTSNAGYASAGAHAQPANATAPADADQPQAWQSRPMQPPPSTPSQVYSPPQPASEQPGAAEAQQAQNNPEPDPSADPTAAPQPLQPHQTPNPDGDDPPEPGTRTP